MKSNKQNKAQSKKVQYNKSEIFRRAIALLKAIPMQDRLDNTWSNCLRKSWHIAKNGANMDTFNSIYNKFHKQLYYHILQRVGNRYEIAEELTQEVFIRLHKHIDNYDVYQAKLNTWLYTIANNLVIDWYRANKNKSQEMNVSDFYDCEEGIETFQFHAHNSDESDYQIDNSELSNEMLSAFRKLKPAQKRIAVLYFIREKEYTEICEICDMPMGTVKATIYRIKESLKVELAKYRTLVIN